MEHLFAYPLKDIPLVAFALMLALSVHEFAHAFVAYKFGDDTAARQGRLTLSPLSHLDVFGTLAIFILGFGWARPVPVNRSKFKKPRLAGILVSIAGPISNFILATLGLIVLYTLVRTGVIDAVSLAIGETLFRFFQIFIGLNLALFVFNLLPLPPLDGYRVVEDMMPRNIRVKMESFENYGAIIFLILVITPLHNYTIQPIFNLVIPNVLRILQDVLAPLFGLL